MLAQLVMSAIARACFTRSTRVGASQHTRRALRVTRSRPHAGQNLRSAFLGGDQMQLDAIGYSDEELIAREIKHHREAIALYEGKANGPDPQLRVFARQILPQLQQHLAMLEVLRSDKQRAGR